jgi:hypothetical protein
VASIFSCMVFMLTSILASISIICRISCISIFVERVILDALVNPIVRLKLWRV